MQIPGGTALPLLRIEGDWAYTQYGCQTGYVSLSFISRSDVYPGPAQDANATGCVLAWHRYNGCMVTGWHQFGRNRFLTHWQKTPGPPEGYPQWENPPGRAEPKPDKI